jgi:hypothetical protein
MEEFENIRYDVQRDRLIGADVFGDFRGRPVKKILLSMTRAMTLKDELLVLDAAHKKQTPEPNSGPVPYPRILFVMSPGIEFGSDSGLPEEYAEIAQLVTIVPGVTNLDSGLPATREARQNFAKQLFRLLRIAHFDADIVLNRERGTSLEMEYVTAKGEFKDLCFIASTSQLSEVNRRDRRAWDLGSAFGLLWKTTGAVPVDAGTFFESAASTYLDRPGVLADVRGQILKTVDTLTLGSFDPSPPPSHLC